MASGHRRNDREQGRGSKPNGPRPSARAMLPPPRSATPAWAGGQQPARRRLEPASWAPRAPPRGRAPTNGSRHLLAAKRARPIETVHRSFYARVEGHLKRAGHAVDDGRHPLGLRLREPTQHVAAAGGRTLARGLADADSKTHEVGHAQRADD